MMYLEHMATGPQAGAQNYCIAAFGQSGQQQRENFAVDNTGTIVAIKNVAVEISNPKILEISTPIARVHEGRLNFSRFHIKAMQYKNEKQTGLFVLAEHRAKDYSPIYFGGISVYGWDGITYIGICQKTWENYTTWLKFLGAGRFSAGDPFAIWFSHVAKNDPVTKNPISLLPKLAPVNLVVDAEFKEIKSNAVPIEGMASKEVLEALK